MKTDETMNLNHLNVVFKITNSMISVNTSKDEWFKNTLREIKYKHENVELNVQISKYKMLAF